MTEVPFLSILTPAVPSRLEQLKSLCQLIENQIGRDRVEHLVLLDNKRRTVGEKRDALLRAARGKYVAFVDDDDLISHDYVALILQKARLNPDVITFLQYAQVNDEHAEIEFRLGNENAAFTPGILVKRNAWHICAWRRSIAILSKFPASNYGEDWAFAAPLCQMAKEACPPWREEHIPKVLHYYRHSDATTEAPPPSGSCRTEPKKTSFPAADIFHKVTGR